MNDEQRLRPARRFRRQGAARGQSRSGAATVELALCLPLVLVAALGMLETCNAVHVRTRMLSAAYEAARLATRPTTSNAPPATSAQVTAYCQTLLTQLAVQGGTVSIQPSDLTGITPLTPVTLTVSAPLSQNTVTSYVLKNLATISVNVTLVVE